MSLASLQQKLLSKKSSGLLEDSARLFLKKFCFRFSISAVGALGLALAFSATPALAYTSPGSPTGYVNDFAHVLSADTVQSLDAELSQFEASTSNQVAVVTVPDMNGDYIENYAVKLFADWGIGQKDKDNGILLLLSIKEHKIRIEVGYGLEGALPDSVAQSIIDNDLTPNLKAGNYDAGVSAAVSNIMLATEGEYSADTSKISEKLSDQYYNMLVGAFFMLIVVMQWFGAVLARSKSWWAGGVVGGLMALLGWAVLQPAFVIGISFFAGMSILGLLLDYFVSNQYQKLKTNGSRLPWWIGGNSRWGGGSGGGFGGFGGGSSGGGGASGGW